MAATPLLTTRLIVPPLRPGLVPRPRLIRRLDEGLRLGHRLTLVSAPAGFGKTTLLSEWAATCERPVAWLSLEEGDNELRRFLAYAVAALRTIPHLREAGVGGSLLAELLSTNLESAASPPSTVKQHLKNIYGKLGVHSRTQAVAQAQELGLL